MKNSEEGITVGLIDGIIAICRILKDRDLTHPEVVEALKDLRDDEDVSGIVNKFKWFIFPKEMRASQGFLEWATQNDGDAHEKV